MDSWAAKTIHQATFQGKGQRPASDAPWKPCHPVHLETHSRKTPDHLAERFARHVLHGYVLHALGISDVVDVNNVGVVQSGGSQTLFSYTNSNTTINSHADKDSFNDQQIYTQKILDGVSKRLGHTDIYTTARIYALASDESAAAEKWEAAMQRAEKPKVVEIPLKKKQA